jgi:hypothetical protein
MHKYRVTFGSVDLNTGDEWRESKIMSGEDDQEIGRRVFKYNPKIQWLSIELVDSEIN